MSKNNPTTAAATGSTRTKRIKDRSDGQRLQETSRSDLKIETVDISTLIPDPNNARKHNEKNLEAIKQSVLKFGYQKPIVVSSDNVVIAGNGFLAVVKELGWTQIKIVRSNLTAAEARAFAIADNRTAELSEWNDIELAKQLAELQSTEAEILAACGFDADEIERRLKALNAELASGNANQEWLDMPQFKADPAMHRSLIVHFGSREHLEAFLEITGLDITDATKYVWWKP
jgi:hypothetical protein